MDMLISLIVTIISQCLQVSEYQVVYLKYVQFLFVHDTSMMGKRKKVQDMFEICNSFIHQTSIEYLL